MNKLLLTFNNSRSQTESVSYTLADNVIAARWIKKIKHLQHIKPNAIFTIGRPIIDLVQRDVMTRNVLEKTHREFCERVGVDYVAVDYHDKDALNQLDDLYLAHYNQLKDQRDNDVLYRFQMALGRHRKYDTDGGHCQKCLRCVNCLYPIGWGPAEGPFIEEFACNSHYVDKMLKNNLYLPWAESGKKKLLQYFADRKPSNLENILELTRPHETLRAGFAVCQVEKDVEEFPADFNDWFKPHRDAWLEHFQLKDWQPRDEHSGVLLAECDDQALDIVALIDAYPTFDSIKLI